MTRPITVGGLHEKLGADRKEPKLELPKSSRSMAERGKSIRAAPLILFWKKAFVWNISKKKPRAGAWRKSPCASLEVAPVNQRGTALQGHTHQGHLSLGFVTAMLPVGLTPSAKQLLPPPACPTPNTTPCKCLPHMSSPEQLEGNRSDNTLHQTTQVEPNEFVSAWTNTSYHMGNGAPAGPPCPLLGLTPVFN